MYDVKISCDQALASVSAADIVSNVWTRMYLADVHSLLNAPDGSVLLSAPSPDYYSFDQFWLAHDSNV